MRELHKLSALRRVLRGEVKTQDLGVVCPWTKPFSCPETKEYYNSNSRAWHCVKCNRVKRYVERYVNRC